MNAKELKQALWYLVDENHQIDSSSRRAVASSATAIYLRNRDLVQVLPAFFFGAANPENLDGYVVTVRWSASAGQRAVQKSKDGLGYQSF